jgi:hypothetical protein
LYLEPQMQSLMVQKYSVMETPEPG